MRACCICFSQLLLHPTWKCLQLWFLYLWFLALKHMNQWSNSHQSLSWLGSFPCRIWYTFPSQGHLLVLENFNQIQLKHGLMEVGYADHTVVKSLTSAGETEEDLTLTSISMTATTDIMGNLVLGNGQPLFPRWFYLLLYVATIQECAVTFSDLRSLVCTWHSQRNRFLEWLRT